MSRMELIAGNFGTGRADYINFEFQLPKKVRLPIEAVASVEENGEYLERSILGFVKGGFSGAAGLGATAMVVGVFAAPLAAVGAIGLTAAAIGAGVGAMGGSVHKRLLMQVLAVDGRGFVAICDDGMPAEIRKAVSVAHALRMRQREAQAVDLKASQRRPSVWERRPRIEPPGAALALAAPAVVIAAAEPTLEAEQNEDGIFAVAGNAISSTTDAAATAASDAYDAASDALSSAWTSVKGRLPWGGGGS